MFENMRGVDRVEGAGQLGEIRVNFDAQLATERRARYREFERLGVEARSPQLMRAVTPVRAEIEHSGARAEAQCA